MPSPLHHMKIYENWDILPDVSAAQEIGVSESELADMEAALEGSLEEKESRKRRVAGHFRDPAETA